MRALSEHPTHHNGTLTGRQLRCAKAATRIVVASELCNGGLLVTGLSCRQAASLTGADRGAISTANHATPDQREALERGWVSLASLRKPTSDKAIAAYVERVGLAKIITVVGPDAALSILDQITSPSVSLAAE
jgi:acyl-CoA hydrolase